MDLLEEYVNLNTHRKLVRKAYSNLLSIHEGNISNLTDVFNYYMSIFSPEEVLLNITVDEEILNQTSTISDASIRRTLRMVPLLGLVLLFGSYIAWAIFESSMFLLKRKRAKKQSFEITRKVILCCMSIIYFVAFYVSAQESRALFGSHGLSPSKYSTKGSLFNGAPTRKTPLFELLGMSRIALNLYEDDSEMITDFSLEFFSWFGVFLSLFSLLPNLFSIFSSIKAPSTGPLVYMLQWIIYLSIVNLESEYVVSYGWEWLTLELGFLCIFLSDWFNTPANIFIIMLFRYVAFRLLLGAGLSKLGTSASTCWLHLNCTTTHYKTQPMPTDNVWILDKLPVAFHNIEGLLVFFEQLLLPFAFFAPFHSVRKYGAFIAIFFQLTLLFAGNYAWINYLSILSCLALLNDEDFRSFFYRNKEPEPAIVEIKCQQSMLFTLRHISYQFICVLVSCFVIFKSVDPMLELFSDSPWLHFYDDYFITNAQGVFGMINKHRVVVEVNYSTVPISEWQLVANNLSEGKYLIDDIIGSYFKEQIYCEDADIPVTNVNGKDMYCPSFKHRCEMNDFIRGICPVTCNTCDSFVLKRLMPQAIKDKLFQPLSFSNLPDNEYKTPFKSSPLHSRLSWETWIKTTASMEHIAEKHLTVKQMFLENKKTMLYKYLPEMTAIPAHLSLFRNLFDGCTDSVSLIDTSFGDLFQERLTLNGTKFVPPTAFMLSYYVYNLTEEINLFDLFLGKRVKFWEHSRVSKDVLIINPFDWNVTGGACPYTRSFPRERFVSIFILTLLTSIQLSRLRFDVTSRVQRVLTFVSFISLAVHTLYFISLDYDYSSILFLVKSILYTIYFAIALVRTTSFHIDNLPELIFFAELGWMLLIGSIF